MENWNSLLSLLPLLLLLFLRAQRVFLFLCYDGEKNASQELCGADAPMLKFILRRRRRRCAN